MVHFKQASTKSDNWQTWQTIGKIPSLHSYGRGTVGGDSLQKSFFDCIMRLTQVGAVRIGSWLFPGSWGISHFARQPFSWKGTQQCPGLAVTWCLKLHFILFFFRPKHNFDRYTICSTAGEICCGTSPPAGPVHVIRILLVVSATLAINSRTFWHISDQA
jgi:hypothetical protein